MNRDEVSCGRPAAQTPREHRGTQLDGCGLLPHPIWLFLTQKVLLRASRHGVHFDVWQCHVVEGSSRSSCRIVVPRMKRGRSVAVPPRSTQTRHSSIGMLTFEAGGSDLECSSDGIDQEVGLRRDAHVHRDPPGSLPSR